jgi:cytidylate kinase
MPWLYDNEKCLKIWLKGSAGIRAGRMMIRDKISYDLALKSVMTRDRNDKRLLFDFYGIRLERDLSPFDLVLNTEKLSVKDVRSCVLDLISKLVI